MRDDLGDRMKALEGAWEGEPMRADLPVYARLDGRGFSKLTRGLERPYDERLRRLMVDTAIAVAREFSALAAYAQSDEISLVWLWRSPASPDGQALFSGRRQKLASVLAAFATARFVAGVADRSVGLSRLLAELPHLDARVLQCPDQGAAADMFAWRGEDARRNSVSQIARSRFSHAALQGRSSHEMRAMLAEAGMPWESFPQECRFGTLLLRRPEWSRLPDEVLARIPEGRRPEDGMVSRTAYRPFSSASPDRIRNLAAALFSGEEPEA